MRRAKLKMAVPIALLALSALGCEGGPSGALRAEVALRKATATAHETAKILRAQIVRERDEALVVAPRIDLDTHAAKHESAPRSGQSKAHAATAPKVRDVIVEVPDVPVRAELAPRPLTPPARPVLPDPSVTNPEEHGSDVPAFAPSGVEEPKAMAPAPRPAASSSFDRAPRHAAVQPAPRRPAPGSRLTTPAMLAAGVGVAGLAIGAMGLEMGLDDASPGTATIATIGLALGGIGFTTAGFLLWSADAEPEAAPRPREVRVGVGPTAVALGGAF